MRFGKKGKLSPRFIGSYEVIEKVGLVAYRLALPPDLEKIHNVFHVLILRRYRSDPSHIVSLETIELRPNLTYEKGASGDFGSRSQRAAEQANPTSQSVVEKPQDRGSHVGKQRSYAASISLTVQ